MPVVNAISQCRSHKYYPTATPEPGTPAVNPNSIAPVSVLSDIESVSQATPDIANNRYVINDSERKDGGHLSFVILRMQEMF